MLGDILLINDMHKEAAAAICERVLKDLNQKEERYRYIVGISGESGSGKSELSENGKVGMPYIYKKEKRKAFRVSHDTIVKRIKKLNS